MSFVNLTRVYSQYSASWRMLLLPWQRQRELSLTEGRAKYNNQQIKCSKIKLMYLNTMYQNIEKYRLVHVILYMYIYSLRMPTLFFLFIP